jgi:ABC-type transport system involved in cytochrome c biogenesis permease subunit
MAIKYTTQGLLIYITIAVYLLAFATTVARWRCRGPALFVVGFLAAILSYAWRWYDVRHVPLQNLFEVFLFLGVACYPISWLCRRILQIGGQGADMFIGAVVLFPAGFVFNAEPMQLPPALQSWLFAPHVAVYMLAYIFMAKAAFQAAEQLRVRPPSAAETWLPPEQATYELIAVGFPLLTLGLILGSWWGKLAWGHYWGWDPKELWSLASWLVYPNVA